MSENEIQTLTETVLTADTATLTAEGPSKADVAALAPCGLCGGAVRPRTPGDDNEAVLDCGRIVPACENCWSVYRVASASNTLNRLFGRSSHLHNEGARRVATRRRDYFVEPAREFVNSVVNVDE
jgi:hypothetical protein